jgi:hypothetical protein
MEPGTIDGPMEGNNAVFVYKVTNVTPAPETENYSMVKAQMQSSLAQRVAYEMMEAMKKASDIEDNRSVFY